MFNTRNGELKKIWKKGPNQLECAINYTRIATSNMRIDRVLIFHGILFFENLLVSQ